MTHNYAERTQTREASKTRESTKLYGYGKAAQLLLSKKKTKKKKKKPGTGKRVRFFLCAQLVF